MSIKLKNGRYSCGYCGKEFTDNVDAENCKESHGLIYIPMTCLKKSLQIDNPHLSKIKNDFEIFKQEYYLNSATSIIAGSNYLKNELITEYKLHNKCISIIPPGIESMYFEDGISSLEFTNIKEIDNIILFVGRINPIKGLDFLLDAIRQVRNKYTLILIGALDETSNKLLAEYQDLIISRKVILINPIPPIELIKIYKIAKIFVMPSREDAGPLAVLEAMAAGTPVIVTNNTGASEWIHENKDGFQISFGDTNSLANIIDKLLENNDFQKQIGINARNTAIKMEWNSIILQYIDNIKTHILGLNY